MRFIVLLSVTAISLASCAKTQGPQADSSSSAASAPSATASSVARRRLQVRITSCVPVGYGTDCSCEVAASPDDTRSRARLKSCVGSGDGIGLTDRLAAAPLVGSSTPPLSLWMDVEKAPDPEGYCGILLLDSGDRLRVVEFER